MTPSPKLFYLVGMPGIGKSYYGQKVSKQIPCNYVDLDTLLEENYQSTIESIISNKGEEFFRLYEALTLRNVQCQELCLISVGGGTPCFHENLRWMQQSGTSIYLHADEETLLAHYKKYQISRPLMKDEKIEKYITQIYKERNSWYSQCDYTINVLKEQSSTEEAIEAIINGQLSSND